MTTEVRAGIYRTRKTFECLDLHFHRDPKKIQRAMEAMIDQRLGEKVEHEDSDIYFQIYLARLYDHITSAGTTVNLDRVIVEAVEWWIDRSELIDEVLEQ